MAQINGTEGEDNLEGTSGDDIIYGLGARDVINPGAGNDTVYGGDGDDRILGYAGDLLDGGNGNDWIHVENSSDSSANPSIIGGLGDDEVSYTGRGIGGSINLGEGTDSLEIYLSGDGTTIAMGSGTDIIVLRGLDIFSSNGAGTTRFTDFAAGDGGEVLDFTTILAYGGGLTNYDRVSNPFGTGHFRLVADGAGSRLNIHAHPEYGVTHSLHFPNIALSEFTEYNFGGFDPSGVSTKGLPINGTADAETITGTELGEVIDARAGDDIVNALGGNDTLIGGAGADALSGGAGDDVLQFDLTFNSDASPLNDTLLDGGAGNDTFKVIGNSQGYQITYFVFGGNFTASSIERVDLSGNLGLEGTAAQLLALDYLKTPYLRVTNAAAFDLSGPATIGEILFTQHNVIADFSGEKIYVMQIGAGDGNDYIIGPDGVIPGAGPSVEVGIVMGQGDDRLIAGAAPTRAVSTHGEKHFTGGAANDSFYASGDGDRIFEGGAGNDRLTTLGAGTDILTGGDGDDVIEIGKLDAADQISGGAGFDVLQIESDGALVDITGIAISGDIEQINSDGELRMRVAQIAPNANMDLRGLRIADAGDVSLAEAPLRTYLSAFGNRVDFSGETNERVVAYGGIGHDVIIGGQEDNTLIGDGGNDELRGQGDTDDLYGGRGNDLLIGAGDNDVLRGEDEDDRLIGGAGNDLLEGGKHIDTAVFSGNRADYTITQGQAGQFSISGGADGTDSLVQVEYAEFADQTVRLRSGTGVAVNFETADPLVYQSAMDNIRDFDGNYPGGGGSWLRIGSADVNGDGDIDQILVNDAIGRFATVGTAPDGLVYFSDYGWGGETRIAGVYIDPLVQSGHVVGGGPDDSQRRFQNDLQIENINRVLGAGDYDGDGLQEVYLALTDGTAYLHAYMHADGNIRYANYQSEAQVIAFLGDNGFTSETWAGWFG